MLRIDTKDDRWAGATLSASIAPEQVTLFASWRKGSLELIATVLVCGVLAAAGYATVWSGLVTPSPLTYAAASLPLVLLAALLVNYVRCRLRPQVPLMRLRRTASWVADNLLDGTVVEIPNGAALAARVVASTKIRPERRFVALTGSAQLFARGPDGREIVVFEFIAHRGISDWSPEERLCRRVTAALSAPLTTDDAA